MVVVGVVDPGATSPAGFEACVALGNLGRQQPSIPPRPCRLGGLNWHHGEGVKYRDMAKALTDVGCTARPGKGDHEKWFCPCGRHKTVITKPGNVSPGVVRQAVQRLSCLPEGWLP